MSIESSENRFLARCSCEGFDFLQAEYWPADEKFGTEDEVGFTISWVPRSIKERLIAAFRLLVGKDYHKNWIHLSRNDFSKLQAWLASKC